MALLVLLYQTSRVGSCMYHWTPSLCWPAYQPHPNSTPFQDQRASQTALLHAQFLSPTRMAPGPAKLSWCRSGTPAASASTSVSMRLPPSAPRHNAGGQAPYSTLATVESRPKWLAWAPSATRIAPWTSKQGSAEIIRGLSLKTRGHEMISGFYSGGKLFLFQIMMSRSPELVNWGLLRNQHPWHPLSWRFNLCFWGLKRFGVLRLWPWLDFPYSSSEWTDSTFFAWADNYFSKPDPYVVWKLLVAEQNSLSH